jgi:shikimate 5-dehydrogenase
MHRVTVIGLGGMGSALTSALLEAGYPVTVWNRTAAKAAPLVDAGASQADSRPKRLRWLQPVPARPILLALQSRPAPRLSLA